MKKDYRYKHGLSHSSTYSSWKHMKQRCLNPKSDVYAYYGGRGITVCERWQSSFIDFVTDMGVKPASSYSIDRIDPDNGYFKNNCQWSKNKAENRRSYTPSMKSLKNLKLGPLARKKK